MLPEGDRILRGRELNAPENQPLTTETKNALQEPSTRGILPHTQVTTSTAGSERSGLGQSDEGPEATQTRYQKQTTGTRTTSEDDLLKPGDDAVTKYVGRITQAANDSIRRIPGGPEGPRLATALDKTLIESRQNFAKWWNAVDTATEGLTKVQRDRVDRALYNENFTKGKQSMVRTLKTQDEVKAYNDVKKVLGDVGDYRLKINEPVFRNGKPTSLIKRDTYYPTTEELRAGDTIRQNTNTAQIEQFHKDYVANYLRHNQASQPQDAEHAWTQFVDSHQGSAQYGPGANLAHFNAIRQQEGTPLPDSLRRTDLRENMYNYLRRAAMDTAHYKNIESDHPVAASLGFTKDAWGNPIANEGVRNINGNNAVQAVMREVRGQIQPLGERNERSVENTANALILGPLTEVHKMLSSLSQAWTYADNPIDAAKMTLRAISDLGKAWTRARAGGVVTRKPTDIADFTDSHLTFAERMNALANAARKIYTINDFTTRFAAGAAQASGEYLMPAKIRSANSGDANSQRLMRFLDPSWTRGKTYTPQEQQSLASVFATMLQGTKDARTLPSWMLRDSAIGAFFKLLSWNVAQTNNFMRFAVKPATEGNLVPLVMTTFGATLGGYVIRELRQKLAGKESAVPSLSDIAASSRGFSGNIPALAYNWISAASYGGLGGIVSLAAKYPMDLAFRNSPNGAIFPLDTLVSNYSTQAWNIADAMLHDPSFNPLDAVSRAYTDIIFHNTQLGRVVMNQSLDLGVRGGKLGNELAYEKEVSDRLGQLKRFKQVEGLPLDSADSTPSNPYLNQEQKLFKHTSDVGEAAQELPELVSQIVTRYSQTPDVMMEKLKALKENSYSIMPDVERTPQVFGRYMDFLQRRLGPQKASEWLRDYYTHRALNEAKSSMVP